MMHYGKGTRLFGWIGAVCACVAAAILPVSITHAREGRDVGPPHPAPDARGPQSDVATTQAAREHKVDPVLEAQLEREIPELKFEAVALGDVVDFLRDVSGANIAVDWKNLEAAGIDRNVPVSARLRNVKLAKVLEVILDSVGGPKQKLIYTPDDRVISITVLDPGEGPVVKRTYDIHDLLAKNPSRGDKVVHTILDSIDAKSWESNGGKLGQIQLQNDKLIVRQTETNQKAIARLLDHIRELLGSEKNH